MILGFSSGPGEALLLAEVESTNDEVRRLAAAGQTGPLWVRAEVQTRGRGRRGRTWLGAPGNVYTTGLFTLSCPPQEAANLSFVAALAVAEAISAWVPPDLVRLKWPNDVLLDGRKACGILLESWHGQGGELHLAVGIGINVLTHPDGLDQPVTCIRDHALPNRPFCTAEALFDGVRSQFHHFAGIWQADGFAPIASAWLARATGLGDPIEVRLPHSRLHGRFAGLGLTGALQLADEAGRITEVTAGDVFFGG